MLKLDQNLHLNIAYVGFKIYPFMPLCNVTQRAIMFALSYHGVTSTRVLAQAFGVNRKHGNTAASAKMQNSPSL